MGELASTIVRVTAQPRLVSTGAAEPVYLAGGGNRAPYRFGGINYRAGLAQLPRFRAELDWQEDGWTGGVIPSSGVLDFAPSLATDYSSLSTAYFWNDAPITVEVGDEGQDGSVPATWATVLNGTIAGISAANGLIQFTIADLSKKLDKPLVTATFAGTGGIEGIADIAGRPKRRTWGQVFNVEARILDKVNSIWEFGDPAFQAASVQAVKDMGRAASPAPTVIAWQGSAAATLTALQGATAVQGSGVVAPSIQCLKWWTTPVGPLTVDFTGEATGSAPQLAGSILTAFGQAFDTASRDAAHTARPDVAGIHIGDDRQTISQTLDQLLLGVSTAWVLDAGGAVYFRPITFSSPVEALTSLAVSRSKVFAPQRKRRIGYQRNHRQHSDGEIAASLVAGDVSGLGELATQNNVYFNGPYLKEALGGVDATLANFKTIQGTAADFTGRGALATKNSVAYGTADVTGFGTLAARATARLGFEVRRNNDTALSDADAITSLGTAADFTGRGALATRNDVLASHLTGVDFSNVQLDPDFQDESVWGWTAGWDTSADTTAVAKLNAKKGSKTPTGNGTTTQSPDLFFYQQLNGLKLSPIEPGKRYRLSLKVLYKAGFTGSIRLELYTYDSAGGSKTNVIGFYGANYRAVAAAADTVETLTATFKAADNARYARLYVLVYWSTTLANAAYAIVAKPTIVRVPEVHGSDLYDSSGYVTQPGYRTAEGTAADFTGRGALATKNAVDFATADVLNRTLGNIAETTALKHFTDPEKIKLTDVQEKG